MNLKPEHYHAATGAPIPEWDEHTLEELEALPVLHQGQADDCHVDEDGRRVWLSRCTVEDGEPVDNKVTVEELVAGSWVEVGIAQAVAA